MADAGTQPDDKGTTDSSGCRFGLTLSAEEHPPRRLIDIAELAEASEFDFVSISDHFHPWIGEQGHSPFVWTLLGALAERTARVDVVVGVTCPIMRIHPAVLAQATATVANLLERRFVWGVGTGEALNEHIVGRRWPTAPERLDMLTEAIEIIRQLWTGEDTTVHGTHFTVENARIYDPPPVEIPVIVSAFGPKAADVAAAIGDGLFITGADADTVDRFRSAGGRGPVYSQLTVCWDRDRDRAIETAHRIWPNTVVPGQLSQDLPTPTHFEQAVEIVTPQAVADSVPCGPDVEPIIAGIRSAIDAGVDHVYLHQIGADQEAFCTVWQEEIRPAL
jgi:coenzyme F420-dependent glucose-6-phosphate dehydrogenase